MYTIIQDAEHHYTLKRDNADVVGSSDKARLLRYCKANNIVVAEFIPLPKQESTVFDPFPRMLPRAER